MESCPAKLVVEHNPASDPEQSAVRFVPAPDVGGDPPGGWYGKLLDVFAYPSAVAADGDNNTLLLLVQVVEQFADVNNDGAIPEASDVLLTQRLFWITIVVHTAVCAGRKQSPDCPPSIVLFHAKNDVPATAFWVNPIALPPRLYSTLL